MLISMPMESWEALYAALAKVTDPTASRIKTGIKSFIDREPLNGSGHGKRESWIERPAKTWWAILDLIADQQTEIERELRARIAASEVDIFS